MVERELTKFPNLTKKHARTMKIFNESGKGYWMEGVGCLRAEGENRPSRPGHIVIGCDLHNGSLTWDVACSMNTNSNASANHAGPSLLILNDQGGSRMDVSEDVTTCLRAQDHWHPPVICFEPGIARREGNDNRFVIDKCCTLRADMGDNQPAVCFQQNKLEMESFTNANRVKCMNPWDPQSKRQYRTDGVYATLQAMDSGGGRCDGVCYALEGNGARPSHKGKGFSDDGTMYTLNTIEQHGVCYEPGEDV